MVAALASGAGSSVRPIVVLAEDNDMLRRYFADILEIAGYEVVAARDGIDAYERLRDRPDASVLVTDIDMPRMDGLTLAQRIREARGEIGVLYVSGREQDEVARRSVPGSRLLRKPCTPTALRDAMLALPGGAAIAS